jgi:hypothetical protein
MPKTIGTAMTTNPAALNKRLLRVPNASPNFYLSEAPLLHGLVTIDSFASDPVIAES